MIKEFKEALAFTIRSDHVDSVLLVLEVLDGYSDEPGVNMYMLRAQIQLLISEIEYWEPEPNDRLLLEGTGKILKNYKKKNYEFK